MSIKVTENEGKAGRRKDGRMERGGAAIKRGRANRRRVNIKKSISKMVQMDIKE